jgi:hypothetical protein
MAYGTPANPVAGTVITVAYAIANLLDPIRALRAFTGGTDPPGTGYVVTSDSVGATTWKTVVSVVLGAIGYTPLNRDGDTMTGPLICNSTQTFHGTQTLNNHQTMTGNLTMNGGEIVMNNDRSIRAKSNSGDLRNLASVNSGNQVLLGDALLPTLRLLATGNQIWADTHRVWHEANDGPGSGLDADTLDGVQGSSYVIGSQLSLVPTGLIAAFATASLPNGWSRYGAADGRFLIGAGTTYGQSFTENNPAGAGSWTHNHGFGSYAVGAPTPTGGAVQSGGASSANPNNHTHAFSGTGGDNTWIPPCRVVVYAIKS